MLAKIHIATKDLGLDEVVYRGLLERVTGEVSASKCTDLQLQHVITELQRLGWRPVGGAHRVSDDPQVRKIYAIWNDLGRSKALRDPSKAALRVFTRKRFDIASPEWLNTDQASQLIELLKSWQRRIKRGGSLDEV
jgi:phage gp16-like protein